MPGATSNHLKCRSPHKDSAVEKPAMRPASRRRTPDTRDIPLIPARDTNQRPPAATKLAGGFGRLEFHSHAHSLDRMVGRGSWQFLVFREERFLAVFAQALGRLIPF